jgi:DNA-binding transcriptional LysR family regulator
MELRHLRYFVAVAEAGGFTRAAARLGMQQPPLSQQLKALERELGLDLFRRHARGVEITPAGAVFLEEARATLVNVEAAAERARSVARGTAGSLTVGLATSAASHRAAPETIAAFRARYPGVVLSFIEGNAAELTEAVAARKADVAFIRAPVSRLEGVAFHTLLTEPLLAAIAKSHPLAIEARRRGSETIELRALARESFILVRRAGAPGLYGDLVAACRKAGFEPRIAAEVGNMFLNTMLVAAGVGVSVVPASMVESHRALVAYFKVRGGGRFLAPLTLVRHEANHNTAVETFCAVARAAARQSSTGRTA